MKIADIRLGAVLIALSAVAVTAAIATLAGLAAWVTAACCVLDFIVIYGIAVSVMRRFVVDKLKPVYRMMLSPTRQENIDGNCPLDTEFEGDLRNIAESSIREIARLKENEKYRKEYIGNVSHELKTPIFNVQGYILTLLDGAIDDSGINRRYLQRAEKNIERLINIVHDLDEITRLESGTLVLKQDRFDIISLAREAVDATDREASVKNIKIVVRDRDHLPLGPIYVNADKRYVMQVFVNLLVNSIKYGKADGRTQIRFVDLFEKVLVEIEDDGNGIAQEDLPRIFERFYRTDRSRARDEGGSGLGLSIVKHIIEAHGETVAARSQLGKGSVFSFTLTKA